MCMKEKDVVLRFDLSDFRSTEDLMATIKAMVHLFGKKKMRDILEKEVAEEECDGIIIEVACSLKMR
jgi:uncharacterized protein involved in propanediol utilization